MARAIVRGFFDKLKALFDDYMVTSIGTDGKNMLIYFKDMDIPYLVRYENAGSGNRRVFNFKQDVNIGELDCLASEYDNLEDVKEEIGFLHSKKHEYELLLKDQLVEMDNMNDRILKAQEFLAEIQRNIKAAEEEKVAKIEELEKLMSLADEKEKPSADFEIPIYTIPEVDDSDEDPYLVAEEDDEDDENLLILDEDEEEEDDENIYIIDDEDDELS